MTLVDRLAIGTLAAALAVMGLGVWLAIGPVLPAEPATDLFDPFGSVSAAPSTGPPGTLVVDVEGGVLRPGVVELPSGSRIADAIRVAGGYSRDADLAAAAAAVNLAALVTDGQQIFVPVLGGSGPGASASTDGGAGSGLVNLNTASPEALDALPGVGPVTVQKIVAARTEQRFRSLDELVTRKVMTSSQLEKVRDLVTLG
ncbi:MAG: helix-hairpin-helix domain-containing protein [Chloroflexota bacterium]|nr:helix-hairpin-helix domain-containing protein [Chloroflexota bacterium]